MDDLSEMRAILASDPVRLHVLALVRSLNLPDCWVAAGFLRNAVWDHLHARPSGLRAADIDVIWFDPARPDPSFDRELEARLEELDASFCWEVKNQCRMHLRNGDDPYTSARDAIRHFPETATAVAVRLTPQNTLEFVAPFGFEDLLALVVRPTPRFRERRHICVERVLRYHSRDRTVIDATTPPRSYRLPHRLAKL
jgi:hypothetical protein